MSGEQKRVAPDDRRLVLLLLLLSFTTGLIDAASVLGMGKVFTANMTGNVVFLGFALARVPGFDWTLYVTALVAFAIGAAVAGRVGLKMAAERRAWLLTIAAAEALLLIAAAALNVRPPATFAPSVLLLATIALTGAAMGARNATIRQLKVADLTTTVLTLTVAGLAADSRLAGGQSPNLARRLLAIAMILAGALSGALLLRWWGLSSALVLAALIVFTATWLLTRSER